MGADQAEGRFFSFCSPPRAAARLPRDRWGRPLIGHASVIGRGHARAWTCLPNMVGPRVAYVAFLPLPSRGFFSSAYVHPFPPSPFCSLRRPKERKKERGEVGRLTLLLVLVWLRLAFISFGCCLHTYTKPSDAHTHTDTGAACACCPPKLPLVPLARDLRRAKHTPAQAPSQSIRSHNIQTPNPPTRSLAPARPPAGPPAWLPLARPQVCPRVEREEAETGGPRKSHPSNTYIRIRT